MNSRRILRAQCDRLPVSPFRVTATAHQRPPHGFGVGTDREHPRSGVFGGDEIRATHAAGLLAGRGDVLQGDGERIHVIRQCSAARPESMLASAETWSDT